MGCLLIAVLLTFFALAVAKDYPGRLKRAASDSSITNRQMPFDYSFSGSFTPDEKTTILKAINSIQENTCIDFKEVPSTQQNVQFYRENRKYGDCTTTNGQISMAGACAETFGSVQHEIMHALGFKHTQSRFDRDNYIFVNFTNIWPNKTHNFDKIPKEHSPDYGVPFEYGSRMMYEAYLYSIGVGVPSIVPNDTAYIPSMGTSKSLTFYDLKALNIRYNCNDLCTEKIDCKNGGYQHPRDCSRCICSDFHDGNYCDVERGLTELEEGAPLELTFNTQGDPSQYYMPKNWEHYNVDPPKVIKAPNGKRIRIELNKLYSETPHPTRPDQKMIGDARICDDYGIEIADEDLAYSGKRFCGYSYVNITFYVSKSNVLGYRAYTRTAISFDSKVTFTIEPDTVAK